mmetsp:Transcript_111852/g.311301  ORF Transcript_111852/g.311301 Transcript_111852/m.311301 type:complete len:207 (+) Transcript_111852:1034-1654(+)
MEGGVEHQLFRLEVRAVVVEKERVDVLHEAVRPDYSAWCPVVEARFKVALASHVHQTISRTSGFLAVTGSLTRSTPVLPRLLSRVVLLVIASNLEGIKVLVFLLRGLQRSAAGRSLAGAEPEGVHGDAALLAAYAAVAADVKPVPRSPPGTRLQIQNRLLVRLRSLLLAACPPACGGCAARTRRERMPIPTFVHLLRPPPRRELEP